MIKMAPPHIPVLLWPAEYCIVCKDPDHGSLPSCPVLTLKYAEENKLEKVPCGCEENIVLGKQGKYFIAITQLQHE